MSLGATFLPLGSVWATPELNHTKHITNVCLIFPKVNPKINANP